MKAGIICNHFFGLPAINYLINSNFVSGIAVPEINPLLFQQIGQMASAVNIPIVLLKKENLSLYMKNWIINNKADAIFVFSFPHKIPESVLDLPKYGFINFHPSPLPLYRGPDPLFYQIKNGETSTGITAHVMDAKYDSGPIIHFENEIINPSDTYGVLESKLSFTLLKCVQNLTSVLMGAEKNKIIFQTQAIGSGTYFGRPAEKDLTISWKNQSAESIHNLVRACNPKFQGALTYIRNIPLRILQVTLANEQAENEFPGTILIHNKERVKAVCGDKRVIFIDVVYLQEGCFSGKVFEEIFNIQAGEAFT